MKKIALLAPLAVLLAASPAFAQDAAVTNMVGPRVEARIGWDRLNLDSASDDGDDAFEGRGHDSGISYGVEVGYDALVANSVVLGAYAGLDFSTIEECSEVFGDDVACLEAGRNITVGVRAGLPIGQNALAYVRGGYSNGRVNVSYDDGTDSFDEGDNRDGFHLGAGFEMAVARNAYARVDYNYTNYAGFDYADEDVDLAVDTSRHQVLLGVGLRF